MCEVKLRLTPETIKHLNEVADLIIDKMICKECNVKSELADGPIFSSRGIDIFFRCNNCKRIWCYSLDENLNEV